MKLKSWLKYLGYTLLVIAAVFCKGYLENIFQTDYMKNYKFNYLLMTAFTLITVIIGVILGLEHLINEMKKEGKWKVNVPKLVLLGIPSLYGSIIYYLASINNQTVYNTLVNPIFKFFSKSTSFIAVFQIILGYLIITAFYKKVKENEVIGEDSNLEETTVVNGDEDVNLSDSINKNETDTATPQEDTLNDHNME